VAGTIARTVAQATIHPIDTIKTRLQLMTVSSREPVAPNGTQLRPPAQLPSASSSSGGSSITPRAAAGQARPPAVLSLHIPKCAQNAYVGLTGAIVGSCTSSFVYFVVYEKVITHRSSRGRG
jgi:hypothetical protein